MIARLANSSYCHCHFETACLGQDVPSELHSHRSKLHHIYHIAHLSQGLYCLHLMHSSKLSAYTNQPLTHSFSAYVLYTLWYLVTDVNAILGSYLLEFLLNMNSYHIPIFIKVTSRAILAFIIQNLISVISVISQLPCSEIVTCSSASTKVPTPCTYYSPHSGIYQVSLIYHILCFMHDDKNIPIEI